MLLSRRINVAQLCYFHKAVVSFRWGFTDQLIGLGTAYARVRVPAVGSQGLAVVGVVHGRPRHWPGANGRTRRSTRSSSSGKGVPGGLVLLAMRPDRMRPAQRPRMLNSSCGSRACPGRERHLPSAFSLRPGLIESNFLDRANGRSKGLTHASTRVLNCLACVDHE